MRKRARARYHAVAELGGVDLAERHVAEDLLIELRELPNGHRQSEAGVGDLLEHSVAGSIGGDHEHVDVAPLDHVRELMDRAEFRWARAGEVVVLRRFLRGCRGTL